MGDSAAKDFLGELWAFLCEIAETTLGRILLGVLVVVLLGVIAFCIGKIHSPMNDSRAQATFFLTNHYKVKSVDLHHRATLTLDAGLYRYEYSRETNEVTWRTINQLEMIGAELPEKWSVEELKKYKDFAELIGATAVVGKITTLALEREGSHLLKFLTVFEEVAQRVSRKYMVGTAIVVVTGIAATVASVGGYDLGYNPNENLSNETMVKTLREKESWLVLADFVEDCSKKMPALYVNERALQVVEQISQSPESSAEVKRNAYAMLVTEKPKSVIQNITCKSAMDRKAPVDMRAIALAKETISYTEND